MSRIYTASTVLTDSLCLSFSTLKHGLRFVVDFCTDMSHYQQLFQLPHNWEWIELGEFTYDLQYGTSEKSLSKGDVSVLRMSNLTRIGTIDYSNIVYTCNKDDIAKFELQEGDLLFNRTNSSEWVGKTSLYDGKIPAIYAGYLIKIRTIVIDSKFLCMYMCSEYYRDWCLQVKTDAVNQSNINAQKLSKLYCPIPPLKEQRRIVSVFNNIIAILTQIEFSKSILISTITDTKSKILELAIQGRLVAQNPTDEPAAEMLKRVNPKAKIITDNPHYPKLPDNWVLTTIKDIFKINPKNKVSDETLAAFIPMNAIQDGFSNSFVYEERPWKSIKSGFTHFADGDVAVAKISPCLENRKSMVLRNLPNGIGAGTTELLIFRSEILIPEFSLLYFKSDYFIRNCTRIFNGVVGQQRVGKNIVEGVIVPVPPKDDQKKIIECVHKWFSQLDKIQLSLQN